MLRILKTQSPSEYAYWTLGFLFCVGMHYFQGHPGGDGLQISFNTFSWIPISFFICFSLLQIVKSEKLVYSELTISFGFATLLLFIPAFYTNSGDIIAIGRFYGLSAGLLVFIGLQQLELKQKQITLLLFFILIGVFVEACIGWAQYFAWIPENVMGYSKEYPAPWGVFRQPNVMSSFLATGLMISAYLLPDYVQLKRQYLKAQAYLCLLAPLFFVPLIILLNSRTGWIASIVGCALILPYLLVKVDRQVSRGWIYMTGLGLLVGLLVLAYSSDGLSQAIAKVQLDTSRVRIYAISIKLFSEHLLAGVGYGNFESAFNTFAAAQYKANLIEPFSLANLHHPHNELIFWAVEGGVLALFGLLLAAWAVLKTLFKLEKVLALAITGLFFPIVFHTQTEYPFYHSSVHWIIFMILIYIADRLGNDSRVKSLKSTILVGTAAIVIPLVTTVFMITTLHAAAVLNRFEQVPGTSPETLLGIVNPVVWRDRLMFTIRGNLMYSALSRGDSSQVEPFIDLVKDSIQSKPRWQRYQDLILAYDFLGDDTLASAALAEAKYRFPSIEFYRLGEGAVRFTTYTNRASAIND